MSSRRLETVDPYVETIVAQGGGEAAVAYVGVLRALIRCRQSPRRWAGTSAGAIFAALRACGLSLSEIEAALQTDFREFTRDYFGHVAEALSDLVRLVRWHGLNGGGRLRNWIADLTGGKRFGDLKDGTELYIYAVPVDELPWRAEEFSKRRTPDVVIADACRASAAIPVFFKPWEIAGRRYVDGGVIANFPISLPPASATLGGDNALTMGLRLYNSRGWGAAPAVRRQVGLGGVLRKLIGLGGLGSGLTTYLSHVVAGLVDAAQIQYHGDPRHLIVDLDRMGIKATAFDTPPELIEHVIDKADRTTLGALKARGILPTGPGPTLKGVQPW